MIGQTVIVLTEDHLFCEEIRASCLWTETVSERCLHALSQHEPRPGALVIIDPSTAPGCCRGLLEAHRPPLERVPFASAQRNHANRPTISRFIQTPRIAMASVQQLAWADRESVLSFAGEPDDARRFIAFAREQGRANMSVSETAQSLNVSVRSLRRMSRRVFGYAPKLLLDLARITSVVDEIEASASASLASIARDHRFFDQSTMDRLFIRFVGISTGRYRALVLLLRTRCRSTMADTA